MCSMRTMAQPDTAQLWLEIPATAWEQAEQELSRYSNNAAAWNAYRHRLCLATVLPWLHQMAGDAVALAMPAAELPSVWEFVAGVSLRWGDTRLLLLADDADAPEPLAIASEWVDVPAAAADYYLACELELEAEPENCGLRLAGYTTHSDLKQYGTYQPAAAAYTLAADQWVSDFALLALARQVTTSRQVALPPLPELTAAAATAALAQLAAQPERPPQLALPWATWGALFARTDWRQQAYEQRLTATSPSAEPVLALRLRDWLPRLATQTEAWLARGWQSVEELAASLGEQPELSFAFRFGGDYQWRNQSAPFPTAVPGLLELLRSPTAALDKDTQLSALYLLGQIGRDHAEAIAYLNDLIQTSDDLELRRQAALSLGKIAPQHPRAGARRAKLIDWGLQVASQPVALAIALIPENGTTYVHLRVSPLPEHRYLPADLQLAVLDANGAIFKQEQARASDIGLQFSLRGQAGDCFSVRVALAAACVTEHFVL